jgi:uncharacterized membrane protein
MSQFLVASSVWLHGLSTVVFVGYYVLLSLIYLPALDDGPEEARGASITAISKRSRNWLYASLVVFAVTGMHLMLADPNYLGPGSFFGNGWSILISIKHLLIAAMVGMGFWFNAILRVGPMASTNSQAAEAAVRFRRHVNTMAVAGALVLLLTAIAQGY